MSDEHPTRPDVEALAKAWDEGHSYCEWAGLPRDKHANPYGWQEEHGWLARFIFWVRGVEHCNDREGQRRWGR